MKTKTLIVGAGEAGKELFIELKKHFRDRYELIGFIDDKVKGQKVLDLEVIGGIDDLDRVIGEFGAELIFIAIPSAQGTTIRRIVDKCQKHKISFKIVPRLLEIVRGDVHLRQVRTLQVEDLLGRAIVQSDQAPFDKAFHGKVILVTGAAGSIGSELCRQLIQFKPQKLICFDWWENGIFDLEMELNELNSTKNFQGVIGSIQDYPKVSQTIKKFHPDIIFHAAAFKHVHLMQRSPDEAIKNNVFGTDNVARAALEHKVSKFVLISTDKAADPSNVMGATKLIGEKIITSYNRKGLTKFSAVRFGNVLGSNGSVVPIFQKQIAQGGPVTVTDKKMTRFVMTIPEAVQLVLFASLIGQGGEVFILDMGEPVKIDDFARLMIRLAGFTPDKEIPIKYVGRRPGEKINEALTSSKEKLTKTSHPRINKAKLDQPAESDITNLLNNLNQLINNNDQKGVFEALQLVAPNIEKIV